MASVIEQTKQRRNDYRKKIGTTIWARGREHKGTITNVVDRWCGGCQCNRTVFSVKWDDGKRTYPCPAGCKVNELGDEEIE